MTTRAEETIQNFLDASNFVEPKKIPVGSDIAGWAFSFAGVTIEEVVDDPVRFAEAYTKIFDYIPSDYVNTSFCPIAAFKPLIALGNNEYNLNDDKTSITHRQAETLYMGPEVYDEIIADANTFLTDTLIKQRANKFQLPKDEAYESLKDALGKYKTILEASMLTGDYFAKNDIFCFADTPYSFYSPFNYFFDRIRGIRNSLSDYRRMPDKVKAACDAIWENDKIMLQLDPEEAKNPLPLVMTAYHSECFLSPKQFDELSWKYFVDGVGPLLAAGKKYYLLCEGSLMHIFDRFRQMPKGSMIVQPDSDDPFEVHKKIGDWVTIMTGVPADMLANGTKEQCVDYVKKCFDTFAPGGGFIFSTNKELISSKDAKAENLIAVFEAADQLSRGRN